MTDVVVSVGMGLGQLAFIKRLRELGYNVIAFGKGKNSEEAEKLCLYSAQLDTHRSKEVIEWIDSLNVNVIGVGSFAGGQAVHTVQVLSDYYNAPTKIPSELMVETSKEEQQKLLEKYHLSSIHTWKAKDLSVEMVKREANDDFIVKPANGRGSKGILFIDKEALKKRLDNHDFQEDDVIQVVKKGREYRCVFIIQNQKIKLLAPILRKSYRNTLFFGVLRYSEKDLNVIEKMMTAFIAQSGITNSIIKADIIVSESSIDVIEMDIGVGGGGYFQHYVSKLFNKSIMDEYINLIVNKPVGEFTVSNSQLRMDYVFNRSTSPIKYDLEKCYRFLSEKLGEVDIQVNILHPEHKGGFSSNADFIFTVIHNQTDTETINNFYVDDLTNDCLFESIIS